MLKLWLHVLLLSFIFLMEEAIYVFDPICVSSMYFISNAEQTVILQGWEHPAQILCLEGDRWELSYSSVNIFFFLY